MFPMKISQFHDYLSLARKKNKTFFLKNIKKNRWILITFYLSSKVKKVLSHFPYPGMMKTRLKIHESYVKAEQKLPKLTKSYSIRPNSKF